MSDPTINKCNPPSSIPDLNIDSPPPFCREPQSITSSGTIDRQPFIESLKDPVSSMDLSWLEEATQKSLGNGAAALCDPQQTGHVINEQGMSPPNRDVVYRYSKSLRGTDEAMKDLFSDIIVYDADGKVHQVPIIWGTQEKAVAYVLQESFRKDESLVVDRPRLPLMSIHSSGHRFNQDRYVYHKAINYLRSSQDRTPTFTTNEQYTRDTVFGVSNGIPVDVNYTLYAWTMYEDDMVTILSQVFGKFSPIAYIRVKGVPWEIGVKWSDCSSNIDYEPGDKKVRVIKYKFDFVAESYVNQPIVRRKAVLKTQTDIVSTTDSNSVPDIYARLEDAVKELEE